MAHIYEGIVPGSWLYRKAMFSIPTPQFIVIYNGVEPYPEQKLLRLSDMFSAKDERFALDLIVPVYNITGGKNGEILKKSKALSDYAAFVSIVRGFLASGLSLEDAVTGAVYKCVEDGIMDTYLEMRGSEVWNMLLAEWNLDDALKYSREEGEKHGEEIGEKRANRANAARMKVAGVEPALIESFTGLSQEEIAEL